MRQASAPTRFLVAIEEQLTAAALGEPPLALASLLELSTGAFVDVITRFPQDTGLQLRSSGHNAVDMNRIILYQLTGDRNLVAQCAVWVYGILVIDAKHAM